VQLTADQLVTKDHAPDRFTIGDGCGAIVHIVLPARVAQDADEARERLLVLAAIATRAADAIGGEP
jgi:hypothetical protein